MKKIAFVRHGKKDGELIAADQITEIENNGIDGLNQLLKPGQEIVICLGSALERTKQTILAFESYMEKNGHIIAQILQPDPRFGNAELFNKMTSDADLMAEVKISGWYNALNNLKPDLLTEIQESQYDALIAIFNAVPNNDQVIIIGHTPMIELLGLYVSDSLDEKMSLKELEGLMFLHLDSGDIRVLVL